MIPDATKNALFVNKTTGTDYMVFSRPSRCIRQDDDDEVRVPALQQDGLVKLAPNLKLELAMFLVEDLFLAAGDDEDVLLRVRLDIEKASADPFEPVADLKVITKGQQFVPFHNTHIQRVYGCTEVVDFGFQKNVLSANLESMDPDQWTDSDIKVVYETSPTSTQPIIVKKITVYTQRPLTLPKPALYCEARVTGAAFVCEKGQGHPTGYSNLLAQIQEPIAVKGIAATDSSSELAYGANREGDEIEVGVPFTLEPEALSTI